MIEWLRELRPPSVGARRSRGQAMRHGVSSGSGGWAPATLSTANEEEADTLAANGVGGLRLALLLASALALSGCGLNTSDGVPGGPAGPSAARVVRRAPLEGFPAYARVPQFSVEAVRNEGEDRRPATADTVRVGIEDDGVDHTRDVFEGRIDIRGASFAWWRPDIGLDPANAAPSRIYVVDSREHDLQAAVRAVIESDPAARGGGAFVHDIAGGSAGWFEIPPLDVAASPEREGAEHGTAVAGVLARETGRREEGRNIAIVPMATPLGAARGVSSWLMDHLEGRPGAGIDGDARDALLARHVSIGATSSLSELHGRADPGGSGERAVEDFDRVWARAVAAKLSSVDIVNISSGSVYPCASIGPEFGPACREEFLRLHRDARRALPHTARAIAQARTPDADKTLVVWAAGNLRTLLGDGARSEAMEIVSSFADLRGHNIGVTALDGARAELAGYAHFCGALPADWDAAADGEHYCLAAPGVHDVDYPYNPGQVTDRGTSFAAPVVSATLAMMKERFRGQLGNVELVKRLMATADDSLHEDDEPDHDGVTSARYGAGVVDPAAALGPVGGLATGIGGNNAPLGATRLRAPAAWGDSLAAIARVEIAAFDARNAPFWIPAGWLVEAAPAAVDPVPCFEDAAATRTGCPAPATLAPRWGCLPLSRGEAARVLVGQDGAGLRVPAPHGLSFSALARSRGRLDGDARGAFSFGTGSSVLAVEAGRRAALDDGGRWSLAAAATLALDLPRGLGTRSGSMFEAGPTLISSWSLSLEHRHGGRRSRLTVSQPARVEAGTGRLRFPSGRRVGGERTFGHVAFPLRPSSRTVTVRWSRSRPAGPGEGIVSVFHSRHPGHARGPDDVGAGVAWRTAW